MDKIQPVVRWMVEDDLPVILKIESDSFEFKWSNRDFWPCFSLVWCNGVVIEIRGRVAGYMVYENRGGVLHVVNLAVSRVFRRLGAGIALINHLKHKATHGTPQPIVLEVRDSNLDAQLFFRAVGMHAVKVMRSFYCNNDDAYQFTWKPTNEECVGVRGDQQNPWRGDA
jgi:ribosomal-protein-alanine N-acetyltransferase